jgi:hypothetical protein
MTQDLDKLFVMRETKVLGDNNITFPKVCYTTRSIDRNALWSSKRARLLPPRRVYYDASNISSTRSIDGSSSAKISLVDSRA